LTGEPSVFLHPQWHGKPGCTVLFWQVSAASLMPSQHALHRLHALLATIQLSFMNHAPEHAADELQDHPGTHVLSLGATPLRIDGPTLLALLRGYPVVGAGWWAAAAVPCMHAWLQCKQPRHVPQQAAFPLPSLVRRYCESVSGQIAG
jgi:hypothetical protein